MKKLYTVFGRGSLPKLYTVFGLRTSQTLYETIHGVTNSNVTKETISSMKNEHNEMKNHYTIDEHHKIIQEYTGELSAKIRKSPDSHSKEIEHLTNVTEKHPAHKSFYTYTGLNHIPNRDGDKVHLPGFTSSSLHPKIAKDFASTDSEFEHPGYKHLLKLKVNKGDHAGAYIAHHSKHPDELEFLHVKDKVIHIHSEPEIDHKNKMVLWHAK